MFVIPRNSQRRTSSHEGDKPEKARRKGEGRGHSHRYAEEPAPLRRHNSEPVGVPLERKDSAFSGRGIVDEPIEEEARSFVVQPEDLQATFENLVCVIKEKGDVTFEGRTVSNMLTSLYEWIVFDKNTQLVIPSEPGSTTVQKMWPQGSKIDTRKKKDRSAMESSSRRLKDVNGDYASTVASSVVSSAIEEEGQKIRKGSVVYSERSYPTVPMHLQGTRYQEQEYRNQVHMNPAYYHPQEHQLFSSLSSRAEPQTFTPVVTQAVAPVCAPVGSRTRYSMVGETVEPPQRVQETPQMESVQVVKRRVRRPRVGASSRPPNGEEEGTEVQFAD